MQQNPDMAQLLQFARSPAGQMLLTLLQQSGGKELQEAMTKASSGDYTQARQSIRSLMENEEIRTLLAQLGGEL